MIANNYGLTNNEIGRYAPSVTTTKAHDSRTERYLYIPTIQVVDALRDSGYVPTMATESRTRMQGHAGYLKHMLRLRKSEHLGSNEPDVPEIVLVNSHDGTSAYNLMAGIFRMVCSNGLIVGDINTTLRVRHVGNIIEGVLTATVKIAEEAETTMQTIAEMKRIELDQRERWLREKHATALRFDLDVNAVEGSLASPDPQADRYNPQALLRVWRSEDRGTDLYTALNVIQENALQGGVRVKNGNKSRQVKGIDQTVKFNRQLWQFAQELREFKLHG